MKRTRLADTILKNNVEGLILLDLGMLQSYDNKDGMGLEEKRPIDQW